VKVTADLSIAALGLLVRLSTVVSTRMDMLKHAERRFAKDAADFTGKGQREAAKAQTLRADVNHVLQLANKVKQHNDVYHEVTATVTKVLQHRATVHQRKTDVKAMDLLADFSVKSATGLFDEITSVSSMLGKGIGELASTTISTTINTTTQMNQILADGVNVTLDSAQTLASSTGTMLTGGQVGKLSTTGLHSPRFGNRTESAVMNDADHQRVEMDEDFFEEIGIDLDAEGSSPAEAGGVGETMPGELQGSLGKAGARRSRLVQRASNAGRLMKHASSEARSSVVHGGNAIRNSVHVGARRYPSAVMEQTRMQRVDTADSMMMLRNNRSDTTHDGQMESLNGESDVEMMSLDHDLQIVGRIVHLVQITTETDVANFFMALFTSLVPKDDESTDKDDENIRIAQIGLEQIGTAKVVVEVLSRSSRLDPADRPSFRTIEALKLGISLLHGENPHCQRSLHNIIVSPQHSLELLQIAERKLQDFADAVRHRKKHPHAVLGGDYFVDTKNSRTISAVIKWLFFIQLLCEGHYSMNQDLLTHTDAQVKARAAKADGSGNSNESSSNAPRGWGGEPHHAESRAYDLLAAMNNVLEAVALCLEDVLFAKSGTGNNNSSSTTSSSQRKQSNVAATSNSFSLKLKVAWQVLRTLTDAIQGPHRRNQAAAIDRGVVASAAKLLRLLNWHECEKQRENKMMSERHAEAEAHIQDSVASPERHESLSAGGFMQNPLTASQQNPLQSTNRSGAVSAFAGALASPGSQAELLKRGVQAGAGARKSQVSGRAGGGSSTYKVKIGSAQGSGDSARSGDRGPLQTMGGTMAVARASVLAKKRTSVAVKSAHRTSVKQSKRSSIGGVRSSISEIELPQFGRSNRSSLRSSVHERRQKRASANMQDIDIEGSDGTLISTGNSFAHSLPLTHPPAHLLHSCRKQTNKQTNQNKPNCTAQQQACLTPPQRMRKTSSRQI
jgi:hypothetical protein